MIILDTKVVSEAMKPEPHSAAREWLDEQAVETLHISSVTLAELLFGISVLPVGKRRNGLAQVLDGLLELFAERIRAFDAGAARRYAELAMAARVAGHGLPTPDGYIAAIAAHRGFVVATRDVAPFKVAGVRIINPWEETH